MNGNGKPLFGSALVTTPMLIIACKPIRNVRPAASRNPNVSCEFNAM